MSRLWSIPFCVSIGRGNTILVSIQVIFFVQNVDSSNNYLKSFQFDSALDNLLEENSTKIWCPTYNEWEVDKLNEDYRL